MHIRYLATAAAALTVWSVSAKADIQTEIDILSRMVDDQLCSIAGSDGYFCTNEFDGEFGSAEDVFEPPKTNNRERNNKKFDLTCDDYGPHPIEDPHCNATYSKPEWRHDSLKLKLESADQEYEKGRAAAGNIYLCTFAADAAAMYADGKLTYDGYKALVEGGVDPVLEEFGIVCDE